MSVTGYTEFFAWGRGMNASTGFSNERGDNELYGNIRFAEVVPGTQTANSVQLRTYVHEARQVYVGGGTGPWFWLNGIQPSNVVLAYSVLGEPAPLAVSINGPSTLSNGQSGTWTADRSGGVSPYAYLWEHKYTCTGGGGGGGCAPYCFLLGDPDGRAIRAGEARTEAGSGFEAQAGGVEPLGPQCGVWSAVGTSYSLTRSFAPGSGTLRLTVTDDVGTVKSATKTVTVSYSAVAGGPEDAAKAQGEPAEAGAAAQSGLPPALALEGAHPNPFNPRTVLRYAVPEAGAVRLAVYDALGREVARLVDGRAEAGHHEATFDASALPSGVYLVRLVAGSAVETMRVTLLK